ncbi:CtrA inhibitor SciP [Roseivivax sp. CAU 1761]
MYLRKIAGPRAVRLPDGRVMTRADLPPADTRRWVASRKAAVVQAVEHGLLTPTQAIVMYALSAEELGAWRRAAAAHGEAGLKSTLLGKFRQL